MVNSERSTFKKPILGSSGNSERVISNIPLEVLMFLALSPPSTSLVGKDSKPMIFFFFRSSFSTYRLQLWLSSKPPNRLWYWSSFSRTVNPRDVRLLVDAVPITLLDCLDTNGVFDVTVILKHFWRWAIAFSNRTWKTGHQNFHKDQVERLLFISRPDMETHISLQLAWTHRRLIQTPLEATYADALHNETCRVDWSKKRYASLSGLFQTKLNFVDVVLNFIFC